MISNQDCRLCPSNIHVLGMSINSHGSQVQGIGSLFLHWEFVFVFGNVPLPTLLMLWVLIKGASYLALNLEALRLHFSQSGTSRWSLGFDATWSLFPLNSPCPRLSLISLWFGRNPSGLLTDILVGLLSPCFFSPLRSL